MTKTKKTTKKSLFNKTKKCKVISPIYNVKLELTKQINKKIIAEK